MKGKKKKLPKGPEAPELLQLRGDKGARENRRRKTNRLQVNGCQVWKLRRLKEAEKERKGQKKEKEGTKKLLQQKPQRGKRDSGGIGKKKGFRPLSLKGLDTGIVQHN